jgi:aminoglycoside/choline kinase family phosphotransferase
LLLDWFLPAINGVEVSASAREAFRKAWAEQFDWLATQPTGWVLRDYHSPNLLIKRVEEEKARLGILDFQDALCGHAAYDLVSLLQDARLDLPEGLEAELLPYYCTEAARHSSFDKAAFLRAYHLLGAQRNTKILGIFARLARRDGKRAYLRHMPRIARYLMANLADPALTQLRDWYSHEIPHNIGERIFQI